MSVGKFVDTSVEARVTPIATGPCRVLSVHAHNANAAKVLAIKPMPTKVEPEGTAESLSHINDSRGVTNNNRHALDG